MECNPNIVDIKKFKDESGLDDETVKELYLGFIDEILGEKDKLLAQFSNNEIDKLAKTVHNLKGVTSSYMAEKIYKESVNLDSRLKQGKKDKLEVLVYRLTDDISETAGEIISYYRP